MSAWSHVSNRVFAVIFPLFILQSGNLRAADMACTITRVHFADRTDADHALFNHDVLRTTVDSSYLVELIAKKIVSCEMAGEAILDAKNSYKAEVHRDVAGVTDKGEVRQTGNWSGYTIGLANMKTLAVHRSGMPDVEMTSMTISAEISELAEKTPRIAIGDRVYIAYDDLESLTSVSGGTLATISADESAHFVVAAGYSTFYLIRIQQSR